MSDYIIFVIQCFTVTISIATGIGVTYLLVKSVSLLFTKRIKTVNIININEFAETGKMVNVTLNNGKIYPNVKFIGITKFENREDLLYPLWNWMVLESSDGKIFIKPESIKIVQQTS